MPPRSGYSIPCLPTSCSWSLVLHSCSFQILKVQSVRFGQWWEYDKKLDEQQQIMHNFVKGRDYLKIILLWIFYHCFKTHHLRRCRRHRCNFHTTSGSLARTTTCTACECKPIWTWTGRIHWHSCLGNWMYDPRLVCSPLGLMNEEVKEGQG